MKEFFNNFNKWGRRILGVGQPQSEQPQADEEQSQASGATARPENSQSTGPAEPDLGEAGRGKDPDRVEGETPGTWNPEQGCLEVETKRVLELGSLSTVLIKLARGKVHVVGTDEVEQPELTITERIYAGSKSEAAGFYKKNGSGVGVKVDSDTLSVTEKNSSGVVSGGSGNVQIEGRSGSVVVDNSYVRGNIFNRVNGGTGGIVIINGEQTGSSQPVAGRETRVVLRVPVANEGEKSEHSYNSYIIKVNSGNIKVENGTGKYTISADAGDIVVEACNMVDSKIENKAGKTKVAAATLNVSEIKSESGDIEVIGAKLNSCSIAGKTGKIAVTGGALDLSPITNESGYIEVIGAKLNSCSIAGKTKNIAVVGTILNSCAITNESGNIEVTDGIFIGENTGENTVKTEAGGILVKFDRDQGEIKVKASVGGYATEKLYFEGVENPNVYFEGVENPNGQTASLILTTQDGEIKVISK